MAAAIGFPMGMRFHPSDAEKITYLLHKVIGLPLPCCSDFIGTADLYGEKEPWEIFGDSDEGELYFFTMLKKIGKKKKGNKDDYKRFSRNVGNGGTWSNKGQKVAIYGKRGGLIGHKRCFRYEAAKKEDDQINGTWLLKEYTLPDNYKGKVQVKEEYKDYVLCVLKRKKGTAPHVQSSSGLDNNYMSATNNIYTFNPPVLGDDPEMRLRIAAKQFVDDEQSTDFQMSTCYTDNNIYTFNPPVLGDDPETRLRIAAKQFVDDEQSTDLQMSTCYTDNNNISFPTWMKCLYTQDAAIMS